MRHRSGWLLSLIGITFIAVLLFLAGCDHNPVKSYRRHLCSVDADGSHFQRLLYNNYTTEWTMESGWPDIQYFHYMNWVFRGNTPRLLIFYNDAIAMAEADGSQEESFYSLGFNVIRDLNVVFPETGSHGFYNLNTNLVRIDLSSGSQSIVALADYYLHYPLCDLLGRYVTAVAGQDQVLVHDLQTGISETWTAPTTAKRAYYYQPGDKLIYTDPPYVRSLDRDSAVADTLFNTGLYWMIRPVGDGSKFLASLPSGTELALFDLADSTYQVLGHIRNTHPLDVCRNGRDVFFADDYNIYRHDLTSGITEPVLISGAENSNACRFLSLSSSPDGQTLYFICETYDYYGE